MKKLIKKWFGYYGLLARIQTLEKEIKLLQNEKKYFIGADIGVSSDISVIKHSLVNPSDMYDDIADMNSNEAKEV